MRLGTAKNASAPDFWACVSLSFQFVGAHQPDSGRFGTHGDSFAAHDVDIPSFAGMWWSARRVTPGSAASASRTARASWISLWVNPMSEAVINSSRLEELPGFPISPRS
jgi:hypothetical protein